MRSMSMGSTWRSNFGRSACIDLTVLGDYLPTPADELPGFKRHSLLGFR